jgi:UDP-N-acetylmuramoyl-L-alanyl-D-glutamate--2,6-diaminopimelate ligase
MPSGAVTPDPPALAKIYARMRRDLGGVRTIAVTGTKGKTSTCEFIAQLMEAIGLRTAVSTTESARIGTRYVEACRHLDDFRSFVARCRRSGIDCLVVELCSSALRWNVHHGLDLDVAVLTNIGTDHIRDHGNRRNYVAVKARMFCDLSAGPPSPAPVAILNADDPRLGAFLTSLSPDVRVCTYGIRAPDGTDPGLPGLWADDVAHDAAGTSFKIHGLPDGPLPCRIPLHGRFNVANVLAALAGAVALGADARRMVAEAGALVAPAGRFKIITAPSDRSPGVVVDYAHTPESVGCALAAARELSPHGRIHVVFGCGGDCYKGKRPMMGAIAARGADTITLTSDNPRTEEPRAIMKSILRGIPLPARSTVRLEPDRGRAIRLAVAEAGAGDVVVILGKGAEQTQEIGGRSRRYSDLRTARRAVAPERVLRLDAESAVLLDAHGASLFEHQADSPHPPASLVKLMTLYLAFDDVAAGRVHLDDPVRISRYAVLTPHPRLPLREGDVVPLRILMQGVAIRSANAAATALAEHLAGAEPAFVDRMNDKARELGLGATRFATPHGLPHRHQWSTARDLARLLGRLVHDHPTSRRMLGRQAFRFRARVFARSIPLFRDPGRVEALKTGFTNEAGYNLAVAARRAGRLVLAVVLGSQTRALSFRDARTVLRAGPLHPAGLG